jgi:hypothetical protein
MIATGDSTGCISSVHYNQTSAADLRGLRREITITPGWNEARIVWRLGRVLHATPALLVAL